MGKIKKLGDMGIRITCSCGNMHEIEQMEDGTMEYDEIWKRKEDTPTEPITEPSVPQPPVVVAPPKERYKYTGLFKRERV